MNPTPNRRRTDVTDAMLATMAHLIGDDNYHRFDDLIGKLPIGGARYTIYDQVAAEHLPWLRPHLPTIGTQLHIANNFPVPSCGRGLIVYWYPFNGANLATGHPLTINIGMYDSGLVHDAFYDEPFSLDYFNAVMASQAGRLLKVISEKTGDIIEWVHRRGLS